MSGRPVPTEADLALDTARIAGAMEARVQLDQAMRTGDVAALGLLFADDLIVHAPSHRVFDGAKILSVYGKFGKAMYEGGMAATFDFVGIRAGMVVMMGEETMPPAPAGPDAGKIVRRRFTDLWSDQNGRWQLVARQATNIATG